MFLQGPSMDGMCAPRAGSVQQQPRGPAHAPRHGLQLAALHSEATALNVQLPAGRVGAGDVDVEVAHAGAPCIAGGTLDQGRSHTLGSSRSPHTPRDPDDFSSQKKRAQPVLSHRCMLTSQRGMATEGEQTFMLTVQQSAATSVPAHGHKKMSARGLATTSNAILART